MKLLTVVVSALAAFAVQAHAIDFTGIFPENVKCIYVVAPASQASTNTIVAATNEFTRCGYKVKVAETVWEASPTAAAKARDIEKAWSDPETDLIICARGGSGSPETAKQLNWDILLSRDIPFVGFSNISALQNAFVAKGVKRPISGPSCQTLVEYPNTAESVARLGDVVAGRPLAPTQLTVVRTPEAAVSGKAIGGHIYSVGRLTADYLPDTTGRIAFLELNYGPYVTATNGFATLKAKGYLDGVAAVVLCDLSKLSDDQDAFVQHVAENVSCPVFKGYPYGHIDGNLALDFNRTATISTTGLLTWEPLEIGTLAIDAAAGTETNVTAKLADLLNVDVNVASGSSGTVILSGTNTYVGTTTLGGGTLQAPLLAPLGEASSLGCGTNFDFQAGTFQYTGTVPATFGHAITFGSADQTIQTEDDLTLAGNLTKSSGTLSKTGAGKLTLTATNQFTAQINNYAGTFELAAGSTAIKEQDFRLYGSATGDAAGLSRFLVSGGEHTWTTKGKYLYVGSPTSSAADYWAEFDMTGGTLNFSNRNLCLGSNIGNSGTAHVIMDVSGGHLIVGRRFFIRYYEKDTSGYNDISMIIRDQGNVSIGSSDSDNYLVNCTKAGKGTVTITIKDGGQLTTTCISRYSTNYTSPIVLVDGGTVCWSLTANVFKGSRTALAVPVRIGTKGAVFAGTSDSIVATYSDVALVATNTVAEGTAQGVTFKTGTHVLTVANSYAGPTVIADDATVVAQVAGAIPQSSALTVKGTLALIKDVPLALDAVPTVAGYLRLYTDTTRTALVSDAGTYPVLNVPVAQKDALEKFAYSLSAQSGGYYSVTDDGSTTATLNLVLGSLLTQPSSLAAEGTRDASTVVFACIGAVEEEGGATYFKVNWPARLRASDSTGGMHVAGWRDETTGDFYWGNDVAVTPTNHTVYTAVFGPAWYYDATAKTISNDRWTFSASASGNDLTVRDLSSATTDDGVLNFATAITNAAGEVTDYEIVNINIEPTKEASILGAQRMALKKLYLPSTLNGIGGYAFYACSNLTGRLDMPGSLRQIDTWAFAFCAGITEVHLPNEIEQIGSRCFQDAVNLETVVPSLPDGLTEVTRSSFLRTKLSGDLRLKNVKRICYYAFGNPNKTMKLNSVEMPSITNIGYRAFYRCTATNYIFGTARVCFDDEAEGNGNGYQTFCLTDATTRHFRFPGLAPSMPIRANQAVGASKMFGESGQNEKVIFHGSWRVDPSGWKKILDEIGTTETTGTAPALEPDDRRIKGQFRWNSGSTVYRAWLIDTKMPGEPVGGLMILCW